MLELPHVRSVISMRSQLARWRDELPNTGVVLVFKERAARGESHREMEGFYCSLVPSMDQELGEAMTVQLGSSVTIVC
jgi:hypothetical protein